MHSSKLSYSLFAWDSKYNCSPGFAVTYIYPKFVFASESWISDTFFIFLKFWSKYVYRIRLGLSPFLYSLSCFWKIVLLSQSGFLPTYIIGFHGRDDSGDSITFLLEESNDHSTSLFEEQYLSKLDRFDVWHVFYDRMISVLAGRKQTEWWNARFLFLIVHNEVFQF